MVQKLKDFLADLITVGLPESEQKWAEKLLLITVVFISLVVFIYSFPVLVNSTWPLSLDPDFEEKKNVLGIGLISALILFIFLVYFIVETLRLITAGIRILFQMLVTNPARKVWQFITHAVVNFWLTKQLLRTRKRWLDYWKYVGFETEIKPFLSYLEPEVAVPISRVTELDQLHLDEKYETKEFIQQVIKRYQRLGMLLIIPLMVGFAVFMMLPVILIVPVLTRFLPGLVLIFILLYILVWLPVSYEAFRAYIEASVQRMDTWRLRHWELLKQEKATEISESMALQTQSSHQERTDALRAVYQQEFARYQQLQQNVRQAEEVLNRVNNLSTEDQESILWLLEVLNSQREMKLAQIEKSQRPKRIATDFMINVLAGLFGALIMYIYGLFQ
jgi:hypothetical protein